jgi:hypothetical protein
MTGGAIAKAPGGVMARVPVAAARFEAQAQARALIEAYLVAFDRGDLDSGD